jgi:hypothetical protein
MADYAMLTPYLVPPELRSWKAVNIGDGFIARSIDDLLRPHACRYSFSTRSPLSGAAIEQINSTRLLILAGANQLTDTFTIAPGIDARTLARIKVPIVPMGIGIHGIAEQNRAMSDQTRAVLRGIHERIRFSSWRCPQTVEYLRRHCPEVGDQALMTCCPVAYREPLLGGRPFTSDVGRIVVTVTERGDFWQRETRTLEFVSRHFPDAEKVLSLHQVFPPVTRGRRWPALLRRWLARGGPTPAELHDYARRRGFTIYQPRSVEECWNLYNTCDLHLGSRLHAHLYFLSQARRSYLTYVDDRCLGIARALGFPLVEPAAWERSLDCDFEHCRSEARRCHRTMDRFLRYVKELLA